MGVLERILTRDHGIAQRWLALDLDDPASLEMEPDRLHARFIEHAPALASQAARDALAAARIDASDIDALVISTCTGYACPGLTSYVSERLALRPDALHLDLVGQGCGAALPNLATAQALLASGQAEHALCICVEVCSAALYFDDDMGVLVSACLFGDGAAAVVASAKPPEGDRRIEWKGVRALHDPARRDALRFEQRDGMLRNILTLPVPALAGAAARQVLDEGLALHGLERDAIAEWIFHGGGRNVLRELERQLPLDAHDLRWSAAVLRDYGNVSSPFVLFVLKHALEGGARPGWWWAASFGAGFSCHGALLKVA
jgi:alkylresorcinol/alkylpyrone synthase